MPDRYDVLGVGIHAVNLTVAVDTIRRTVRDGGCGYVCVTGVHGVMESQKAPELRQIHNDSLLTVPDGMPLVWIARRRGLRGVGRVYGPDLMRRVLGAESEEQRSENRGPRTEDREPRSENRDPRTGDQRPSDLGPRTSDLVSSPATPPSHYLLGSTPSVLERLSTRIASDFPRARIADTWSPPFRDLAEDEWNAALRRVRESGASIVWVGLGTPKQERFMAEFLRRWKAEDTTPRSSIVLVGVGAAFDVLAGLRPDAPPWIQHAGLQWLYRLCQEPRRLGLRYLRIVPGFLWRLLRSAMTGKRGE